jgi:DNA-cytosine methyltransferase
MLNSVDLFTGIGGFALAFKGVYKPLLYCDKDPDVLLVLDSMMRKGVLPRADVVDDVKNTAEIVKAVANSKVDLLTAGFPCTGFSKAGAMEGLGNEGSSLFFHATKVIKALRPTIVCLENVAEIAKSEDIRVILTTLSRLGYSCTWTTCSGRDVGSPQHRRRWFCLCIIKGHIPVDLPVSLHRHTWTVGRMPRLTGPRPKDFASRYSMLGNTIIPAAAWLAFVRMYTGFSVMTFQQCQSLKIIKHAAPAVKTFSAEGTHGYMSGSVMKTFNIKSSFTKFDISVESTHYDGAVEASSSSVLPSVKGVVIKHLFPTPRASMWRHSNVLTKRTMRDLPAFVLFVTNINGVPQPRVKAGMSINLAFLEWLMGFPVGWTSK